MFREVYNEFGLCYSFSVVMVPIAIAMCALLLVGWAMACTKSVWREFLRGCNAVGDRVSILHRSRFTRFIF